MKIIVLVAIALINICAFAFSISTNNGYEDNSIENSELLSQDEAVYLKTLCILVNESKSSHICYKNQTIIKNLVKNFFHPPR